MRIRWSDLDANTYERMVAVLLNRLYPTSLRIDGSGGDGGRDVQIGPPDNLLVFELKSFTGRVTKTRRAQVERSLKRASALNPQSWTLVVPIDPTPDELKWFDKLQEKHPFPLAWRGLTWLDSEMSARPDIERYYIHEAADEVVALLAQWHQETLHVEDASQAVERLRMLHGRLNEIDPHYRYELATGAATAPTGSMHSVMSVVLDDVRVSIFERYVGALRDRPITIDVTFAVPSNDVRLIDQITQAFDYGTPVAVPGTAIQELHVDAPGGLGGSFGAGDMEVQLGPALPANVEPKSAYLEVRDGDRVLASIPIEFIVQSTGQRGGILYGTDSSGCLRIDLTIDVKDKRSNVSLRFELRSVLPSALVPLLKCLAALRPPYSLCFRWPDVDKPFVTAPLSENMVENGQLELIEALAYVQQETGTYFPIPLDLTTDEIFAILNAKRILSGEQLRATWSTVTLELTLSEPVELNHQLLKPDGSAMLVESHEVLHIRDHKIPLGKIRTQFLSARPSDLDALNEQINSRATSIKLSLVPVENNQVVKQRVAENLEK